MKAKVSQKKDGTVTVAINTTSEQGQKAKDLAIAEMAPQVKVDGFRPGKAPPAVVERQVNSDVLLEKTLGYLAGQSFNQAIQDEKIFPISRPTLTSPKIDEKEDSSKLLNEITEKGIEMVVTTHVVPEVQLGNWSGLLKKVKAPKGYGESKPTIETASSIKDAKSKAEEKPKATEPDEDQTKLEREFDELIVEALTKGIEIEVSPGLIEIETQNQLMQQVQIVQQLGIDYRDYLKNQGKELEDVEKELKERAIETLKVRFIITQMVTENTDLFGEEASGPDVARILREIAVGDRKVEKKAKSSDKSKKKASKSKPKKK